MKVSREQMAQNRQRIVITEIPYMVNKAKMVEKGLALYSSEQLFQELKKREASDLAAVDGRFYQKFLAELEQQTVTDLRSELALLKVTQGLQQKSHRRRTEALE